MSDLTIRRAHAGELDAVGALTVRAYEADGYFGSGTSSSYAVELADARARADTAELLVAVDPDGRLLGTATVAHPGTRYAEVGRPGELELRMLAVDPDARHRGVGVALVQAVLDRARELGRSAVVLCSQEGMTRGRELYERLGFHRLPARDWRMEPATRGLAFRFPLDTG